jgi:hypothetical protein
MRIRQLRWRGFAIWPPEWPGIRRPDENGLLQDVQIVMGAELLRIAVAHDGRITYGLLPCEPKPIASLYHIIKKHIGRPLTEIGDLEIDFDFPPRNALSSDPDQLHPRSGHPPGGQGRAA